MRKAYLQTENSRGRVLSGHGERPTERHTHFLVTADGGTDHDMERNRSRKAYSPTGDGRKRNWSGQRKKSTQGGTLTVLRWQKEGLVRTSKETNRGRCTYFLETVEGKTCQYIEINQPRKVNSPAKKTEGGICQDTGRNQSSESDSLPGDGRGMNASGHGKKSSERGTLTT